MSKTKFKKFSVEDKKYQDGANSDFQHIKEERNRDKRKERRFEHALKTKNVDELLDEDFDDEYFDMYGNLKEEW